MEPKRTSNVRLKDLSADEIDRINGGSASLLGLVLGGCTKTKSFDNGCTIYSGAWRVDDEDDPASCKDIDNALDKGDGPDEGSVQGK
ncbi:MAG TPA: hypothetical protein PKY77_26465 [Phycisphaerae bacterium]|nr:hypothetical protein [Phycisphaerae bacterium]HSA30077.1 hypothetical protein [Phycisphaerae bacterium]